MVDEVENKPKFVLNKKKSDAPVPEVQDDSQKNSKAVSDKQGDASSEKSEKKKVVVVK